VMRYAVTYKPDSEPLDQFIRRKGGINGCAARFSSAGAWEEARSDAVGGTEPGGEEPDEIVVTTAPAPTPECRLLCETDSRCLPRDANRRVIG
jgi:hypothetical protein